MAPSQSLVMAILSVAVIVEGGVRRLSAENRIIGGAEIVIYQVPWQVSLQKDGDHICGGVIISNRWVLTAAHCTIYEDPSDIWLRVGSNSKTQGGILYQAEKIVNHEEYHNRFLFNDISALMTKRVIKFGRSVGKVKLPKLGARRPPVGTILRVSGWGFSEDSKPTNLLKAVEIVLRDFDVCRKYYTTTDESKHICAGSRYKKICEGDSGGPLVKGKLLVGLVSYTDNTCRSPGDGFTDVAVFRRWIKTNTGV